MRYRTQTIAAAVLMVLLIVGAAVRYRHANAKAEVGGVAPGEHGDVSRVVLAWSNNKPALLPLYENVIRESLSSSDVELLIDRPEDCSLFIRWQNQDQQPGRLSIRLLKHDSRWVRDYSPWFAIHKHAGPQLLQCDYLLLSPLRPLDDAVSQSLGLAWGLPVNRLPLAMDGGILLTNGSGLAIVSDRIVDQNKFWAYDQLAIEQVLKQFLFFERCVFVAALHDEPTGHLDMFVSFLNANTVLVGSYDAHVDLANSQILDEVAAQLGRINLDGEPLKVVRVTLPPHDDGVWRTFTNVLQLPDKILVPQYPGAAPELSLQAIEIIKAVVPEKEVIGIDVSLLSERGGALHCISKTYPAFDSALFAERSDSKNAIRDSETPGSAQQLIDRLSDRRLPTMGTLIRSKNKRSDLYLEVLQNDRRVAESVRIDAAFLLVADGFADHDLQRVIKYFGDANPRVRWLAMVAVGKQAERAYPELVKAMKRKTIDAQSLMFCLRLNPHKGLPFQAFLLDQLSSGSDQSRVWAFEILAELAEVDSDLIGDLQKHSVAELNPKVREAFEATLGAQSIGSQP